VTLFKFSFNVSKALSKLSLTDNSYIPTTFLIIVSVARREKHYTTNDNRDDSAWLYESSSGALLSRCPLTPSFTPPHIPQPCSFSWHNCFNDETRIHQPTVIQKTRLTLDTLEESTRDECCFQEREVAMVPAWSILEGDTKERKTPADQPQRLINARTSHGDA
jgi:hypothetical protein